MSNREEVDEFLDALVPPIDFTAPGKERSIGRDLARVITLGESNKAIGSQQAPDGSRRADNEERYARSNGGRPGGEGPDRGGRPGGGDMRGETELTGEVTIRPD